MKIEKLTKKQERQLVEYRNEMLANGRSTQPSDRVATETAIKFFYAKINKPEPKFFWFDGPFTGLIAIELLKQHWPEMQKSANLMANLGDNLRANLMANLRDNLRANLGDNLMANLMANLGANLGDNLMANLWANLRANLRANLGDNLMANLMANLWDNLRDNLMANLWDNLGDNMSKCFWGQHELAWTAFYEFGSIIGVPFKDDDKKLLTAWVSLGKSTGWWCAFDGICFCFERPKQLNLDEEGRLHSLTAPAMEFRDTYALFAVHGVRVPEYIILRPSEITVAKIESEPNAEIRRVMIERYGQAKFLMDSHAKEIHQDDFGTLYFKEVTGDEPLVMVKVVNSTAEPDGSFRDYFIRVDPRCRPILKIDSDVGGRKFGEPQALTARNAVASTFGKRGEEYEPLVET